MCTWKPCWLPPPPVYTAITQIGCLSVCCAGKNRCFVLSSVLEWLYPHRLVKTQDTRDLAHFQVLHQSPEFNTQKRCHRLYKSGGNLFSLQSVPWNKKKKTSVCCLVGKSYKCVTYKIWLLSGRCRMSSHPIIQPLRRYARLVEEGRHGFSYPIIQVNSLLLILKQF